MAHPFLKLFLKALKGSDEMNNLVTKEATKLIDKGYSRHELYEVLNALERSLIDDNERSIVAETIAEVDLFEEENGTE